MILLLVLLFLLFFVPGLFINGLQFLLIVAVVVVLVGAIGGRGRWY